MPRKLVESIGSIGFVLLILGLFNYSITNLWDWKTQAGIYGGGALCLLYLVLNFRVLLDSLKSRSVKKGGAALITLILVLGILVLLNFLNFRHHQRVDLSEGQLHALSEQTQRILDNLDQDIRVIGFFADEAGAAAFQETVKEYHFYSPRIEYEVVDPQKDPSRVAQYDITRSGQIIVAGTTKRETIDEASEESLTNTIIKVTREEEKTVYFLTGHGERSLDGMEGEGYSTARTEIEKQNYRVETYNLAQENRLPEDAAVMISAGPGVGFFPNEIELLNQFLAQGGKFFLLIDPESEATVDEFLSAYGIELRGDFVVDASGLGQLFGFGAGAPLAADYADHPVTEDLEGAMTIFPGSQSVASVDSVLDYAATELVRTSPQSWGEAEIEGESVAFDEGVDRPGPLALAVAASKTVPAPESGPGEESEGTDAADLEEGITSEDIPEDEDATGPESRIVVFGDADFASNAYFGTSVNSDLFLNVVSWLAEDADLLSIRPRDPESRTITLTGSESRLIFWATVILFPLVTFIFGLAIWYRRR